MGNAASSQEEGAEESEDSDEGEEREEKEERRDPSAYAHSLKERGLGAFEPALNDPRTLEDIAVLTPVLVCLVDLVKTARSQRKNHPLGEDVRIPSGQAIVDRVLAGMAFHALTIEEVKKEGDDDVGAGGGEGGDGDAVGGKLTQLAGSCFTDKVAAAKGGKTIAAMRKEEKKRQRLEEACRLQKLGCEVLSHLCKLSTERPSLLAAGAVATIVEAMRKCPRSRGVQWWGANALFFLCRDTESNGVDLAALREVREGGGDGLCDRAMARFRSDHTLLPHVQAVVRMLEQLSDHDRGVLEAKKRLTVDPGGRGGGGRVQESRTFGGGERYVV